MRWPRYIPPTTERPLNDVLLRVPFADFTPTHPDRPPWAHERLEGVQHAYTGNVAVVNLAVADRVQLRNLDQPSYDQDWLEYGDWTRAGWGVPPA
jgi:hypothetical protein